MRKSDKKLDNQIRKALTALCEDTFKDLTGFCFVTHTVNYQKFPQTLQVACVFEDAQALLNFKNSEHFLTTRTQIENALKQIKINIAAIKECVIFITKQEAP